MTTYFMYHRTSQPTGAVLARALGVQHGRECEIRTDALIRWGAQASVAYMPALTVNRRDALAVASDKYASLQRMSQNGVPVPKFSQVPSTLTAPMLGRDQNHTRGADIVLCMNLRDAERVDKHHYVEYVPTAREYRVHVFDGRAIRSAEKVLTNPDAACGWIRNYENGCTFRRPRTMLGALQEAAAIQAVQALGLVFGAVDLIVGDDGNTYILEVNTAPACAPMTGRAYVDAMVAYLGEKGIDVNPDYEVLNELVATDGEDA